MKPNSIKTLRIFQVAASLSWLFLDVLYCEVVFSILIRHPFGIYTIGFSLCSASFLTLAVYLIRNAKARFVIMGVITVLVSLIFLVQLVYFRIFNTLFIVQLLSLAGGAATFWKIALDAISSGIVGVILLLLPVVLYFALVRIAMKHVTSDRRILIAAAAVFVASGSLTTSMVMVDKSDAISARTIFLSEFIHEQSVDKFGLLTATGLDIRYNVLGIRFEDRGGVAIEDITIEDRFDPPVSTGQTAQTEPSEQTGPSDPTTPPLGQPTSAPESGIPTEPVESQPPVIDTSPNVMDIVFNMEEENSELLEMNLFFSNRYPTNRNEYTGMFQGKNLILITAEAFSMYVIDPDLTPTLYMLSTEGFVFNNFYTPIWNVSTASGEYVAMNGLLPDLGTTKYVVIQNRYMPFSFANQFKELGYAAKAYHNHTYTYYDRHITYPNLGYEYKGYGSGLNVKYTWPESDLEMIELTYPEYIDAPPFHVYYLTVSGHCNYSFSGNYIAAKNKDKVARLSYSAPIRAYLAAQLELEYALTELLERLDTAGQLENTVIALSTDHYPYDLVEDYGSFQYINELAGKEVESTFELYKNAFILWSGDMKEPVIVDKYCSSLDIAPTLSNLFGLEYDSRLYIGTDILSDSVPYVIFKDYSFINDKIMYDNKNKKVIRLVDEEISSEYLDGCIDYVRALFRCSRLIYRNDYYGYLFDR